MRVCRGRCVLSPRGCIGVVGASPRFLLVRCVPRVLSPPEDGIELRRAYAKGHLQETGCTFSQCHIHINWQCHLQPTVAKVDDIIYFVCSWQYHGWFLGRSCASRIAVALMVCTFLRQHLIGEFVMLTEILRIRTYNLSVSLSPS